MVMYIVAIKILVAPKINPMQEEMVIVITIMPQVVVVWHQVIVKLVTNYKRIEFLW